MAKPKDIELGRHSFKGLRFDRNGNPLYTSNTLSNDEAKKMGWKFSKKHGLYGQIDDPTRFYESKKQVVKLSESDLHRVIKESVKRALKEDIYRNTHKMLKKSSPHTQKMVAMFDDLRSILNEIGKYAEQQGIWSYSTPKRGHFKGQQYTEIKDTIQRMLLDADTLENTWGKHLSRSDKDYKSRPEFQLSESGDLYGRYDDGTPFTNSKDKWHGVEGTTFISHGEWSDPEVWYDGEELNGTSLEDFVWAEYEYECEEMGKTPSEQEYDKMPVQWFEEKLDDYMYGMFGE